jgi:hypothetical protein
MHDDFGVALRVKVVAAAFKLTAQFGKVINLTVEYDPDALVLVVDRLASAR